MVSIVIIITCLMITATTEPSLHDNPNLQRLISAHYESSNTSIDLTVTLRGSFIDWLKSYICFAILTQSSLARSEIVIPIEETRKATQQH